MRGFWVYLGRVHIGVKKMHGSPSIFPHAKDRTSASGRRMLQGRLALSAAERKAWWQAGVVQELLS